MPSPKYKDVTLWVLALDGKDVREIDENGRPLMEIRVVGKTSGQIIPEGVRVPYHSHYIARLKEGMLLPMDLATAQLAGVNWNPLASLDGKAKHKPSTIKSTQ